MAGVAVAVAAGVARGQPHRVLPLGVGDGASVRAYHRLGCEVEAVLVVVLQQDEERCRVAHHLLTAQFLVMLRFLRFGSLGGEHVRYRRGHIEYGSGRRVETLSSPEESGHVKAEESGHVKAAERWCFGSCVHWAFLLTAKQDTVMGGRDTNRKKDEIEKGRGMILNSQL